MWEYQVMQAIQQDREQEIRHMLREARDAKTIRQEKTTMFRISGSIRTLLAALITLLALYGGMAVWGDAGQVFGAPNAQNGDKVPTYMNYQGVLRDPEGNLISGVRKMTFRIYNNVADPVAAALWTEEHAEVTLRDGYFSVLLGSTNPVPTGIFQNPDRYIGVTVDPYDEMVPRQRFASVPYAMVSAFAHDADTVDGQHAAAFAGAGHKHNALSAGDGTPEQAVYVNDDGNIGIGTTDPQGRLHVVGSTNSALRVQDPGATLTLDGDAINSTSTLYLNANSNRNVTLAGTANVGIGTVNPARKLDVNGDTRINGKLVFGSTAKAPVVIRRFTTLGNDGTVEITGITPTDYECTVGAWSIRMDIDESGPGPFTLWTYAVNNRWELRYRFYTDNSEQVKADVVCFLKAVTDYQGPREDQGFN